MANSIMRDRQGPDWPLGNVAVPTPGTPVNIMSVVDPQLADDPSKPVPGTSGAGEYTALTQQIMFQALKHNGTTLVANTGNVFVVRKSAAGGSGGRADAGTIVKMLTPGETWVLGGPPVSRNSFSPYRYSLDADTALDACQVTLIIG